MKTIIYILGGIVLFLIIVFIIKTKSKNNMNSYYSNNGSFMDKAKNRAKNIGACCFKFLKGGGA